MKPHTTKTRIKIISCIVFNKTKYSEKLPRHMGRNFFKKLQIKILESAKDINTFKKIVKVWLVEECFYNLKLKIEIVLCITSN